MGEFPNCLNFAGYRVDDYPHTATASAKLRGVAAEERRPPKGPEHNATEQLTDEDLGLDAEFRL
jgi:hypothetical protein